MRRRGYDVEANPRMAMPLKNWLDMFEGFKPLKPAPGASGAEAKDELAREISSWGEGARAAIYGVWDWRENYGHFFSAEVRDGRTLFVDPQNGSGDAGWYFGKMKPDSIIFGRIDGLSPGINVEKACKNTGGKQ
jgi:hypothetical protein